MVVVIIVPVAIRTLLHDAVHDVHGIGSRGL